MYGLLLLGSIRHVIHFFYPGVLFNVHGHQMLQGSTGGALANILLTALAADLHGDLLVLLEKNTSVMDQAALDVCLHLKPGQ